MGTGRFTVARHSRLKSSTMHKMRKRRPSPSASETQSSDQRWLIARGMAVGARVPSARLRRPRRRTISFSSRYADPFSLQVGRLLDPGIPPHQDLGVEEFPGREDG